MEDKRVGSVSGYFMILHDGHINLLREARSRCDWLIVIINNDEQMFRKHGHPPVIDQEERKRILESIRYVDEVVISVDQDRTVSKTLEMIKSVSRLDYFFNGGDVVLENCYEKETCARLGIEMVFGVGGEKTNSSSRIWQSHRNWEAKEMGRKCDDLEDVYLDGASQYRLVYGGKPGDIPRVTTDTTITTDLPSSIKNMSFGKHLGMRTGYSD